MTTENQKIRWPDIGGRKVQSRKIHFAMTQAFLDQMECLGAL
jgi:hypothetical protein